ncbi:MAG: hypothetical protein IJK78_09925 [Bacteroidales bacterium]|nr:hypothetical protein [Bacteroidales bacterium]
MNRIFRTIAAAVLLVFAGIGTTSCCKTESGPNGTPYISNPKPVINMDEIELKVGDSLSLWCGRTDGVSYVFNNQDVLEVDSWDSDHPEIATVEKVGKYGRVKAISPGKCRITATYQGESDYCKVTVTE